MDKRTELEREADLQSAQAHRDLASDPVVLEMPGRREWHMEQATRHELKYVRG